MRSRDDGSAQRDYGKGKTQSVCEGKSNHREDVAVETERARGRYQ